MPTARPRFLVPAILLCVLAAVVGAYGLLVLMISDTQTVRTTHRGVDELVVTAHSGDIELVGAAAGAPLQVTRHVSKGFESPKREESFEGGRLKLDYSCSGWPLGNCGVRYVIAVPPETSVVAISGSGDVAAEGLRSRRPLALQSGSGDVVADGVSASRIGLESGSGGVTATNASARLVSAESGSGEIVVDLASPVANLRASSGSGDMVMTLPDVSYALQATAPAGGVFNDGIRVDSRSPRRIDIDAGSGEVRLVPVS